MTDLDDPPVRWHHVQPTRIPTQHPVTVSTDMAVGSSNPDVWSSGPFPQHHPYGFQYNLQTGM